MSKSRPAIQAFPSEPRVATLTTLRPDGAPQVVAVRFTWDGHTGLARVLTGATVAFYPPKPTGR
ncbi:pyridoxamine 5'-phosphate oxidase family protein [Nonomuraea sp. NPDC049152]|uniref:pyridoxamine 5'-phosphate oxidase family protein n=1 Tax=Nonomuraea sp. NPDC049152 TaxID=3154350 RepID=UPI0033F118A6